MLGRHLPAKQTWFKSINCWTTIKMTAFVWTMSHNWRSAVKSQRPSIIVVQQLKSFASSHKSLPSKRMIRKQRQEVWPTRKAFFTTDRLALTSCQVPAQQLNRLQAVVIEPIPFRFSDKLSTRKSCRMLWAPEILSSTTSLVEVKSPLTQEQALAVHRASTTSIDAAVTISSRLNLQLCQTLLSSMTSLKSRENFSSREASTWSLLSALRKTKSHEKSEAILPSSTRQRKSTNF